MNKNTEVLIVEYNTNFNIFDRMYEIINIDYAPLILKKYYEEDKDRLSLLNKLTEWFKGRGIPSWRDKLDLLIHRLGIEIADELLKMLKKAWIIEDNVRYLLKGGYKNEILQPFNEVLASMICERLGFDHVP